MKAVMKGFSVVVLGAPLLLGFAFSAPREVTAVAAADSTGQVQLTSPTVRKRTDNSSTVSPAREGVISVTGTSRPLRRTTGRRCA